MNNESMKFVMPKELKDKFKVLADSRGLALSSYLRLLMINELKEQGDDDIKEDD